jgi:hypothetical protein
MAYMAWAHTVSRFLAANGVSSFTRYPTQAFAAFVASPNLNCNASGADSATAAVIMNVNGTTAAGKAHASNTTWGSAGLATPAGLRATVVSKTMP